MGAIKTVVCFIGEQSSVDPAGLKQIGQKCGCRAAPVRTAADCIAARLSKADAGEEPEQAVVML